MPQYENEQPISNLRPTYLSSKPPFQQKSPDEIGACWSRFNDKGIEYLSIKIEIDGVPHNLKGFLNGKATHENHPKFLIYKSKNINKHQNKEMDGNR